MKKKQLAKAIVQYFRADNTIDQNSILVETHVSGKEVNYTLPQALLPLGADPVKELKYELKSEYELVDVQFLKSLPDSWSRLLFLHGRDNDILTLYYIFAGNYKKTKTADKTLTVVDLTTTNIDKTFSAEDKVAVEYYLEMYGIITPE